jgi:hypothetical protein
MISFIGGPAEKAVLSLRRTPIFLRVVIDRDGTVDALDQLDDKPRPSEQVYVYRIDGNGPTGFACSRGKGCSRLATYRYYEKQPAADVLHDWTKWSEWTEAEYKTAAGAATTTPAE